MGQEEQGDKPRSVLRALRLAFARSAGEKLQLPMSVIGARQSSRMPDDLARNVGEDWLLLQFRNGDGASAAVCVDQGTVSAVIQVQTIGEVMPGAPTPRAFTDTDAAMVAPLVEDALTRAASLVDASGDQSSLTGCEFTTRLADLRTLSLAMVEDAYRVFDLTVELAGGLRQGQVAVFLSDRPADSDDTGAAQDDIGPNLEQASGVLRADLNTVICRMSLPLSSLSELRLGDVLPLTGVRLDRAEILTIDRNRAAIGRLGQCGGMRAVRLNKYVPLLTLAQSDVEGFQEARSQVSPHSETDISAPAEMPLTPAAFDLTPADEIGEDLSFADSDRMVAEISQLAGLTPGEDPNGVS